jgi:hypothetical protein
MREDAVTVGAGGDVRGVRELRASRFTLVDRHGNPRAALGIGEDGSPSINLLDPGDQPRMTLSLEASGAANVKLLDADGDVRVWLSVSPNGAPSLYLRGTSRYADGGTGHAELAIDEHGCPALSLCDTGGQPRLLLGLDEKAGMPRLSLSSGDGDLRALLIADRERGALHLYPEQPERDQVPTLPLHARTEATNGAKATNGAGHAGAVVTPLAPPGYDPEATAASPESRANGHAAHLKEPLESLERQPAPKRSRRRYLRAVVPLLVLAVAGLGAAGYSALTSSDPVVLERDIGGSADIASTRTIEAEEFVLRGRNGNVRARLGLLPDGSPFLQLTGNGDSSAELSVLPSQGPVLKLSDGKAMVSMRAKGDGSSEITLHSEGQEPRAAMFLESDGTPVLSLTDAEGRVRAGLTISADGGPSLSLYDEASLRAMLGTTGDRASLTLLDRQGRLLFSAPSR